MPEGKGRFSLMLFIIRVHLCNLSADKGVFVANAPRRLRLRTNLEIYWDFIGWAVQMPKTPLKKQLLDIQLDYVERLLSGDTPSPSEKIKVREMSFSDMLEKFTCLVKRIQQRYKEMVGDEPDISGLEFKKLKLI